MTLRGRYGGRERNGVGRIWEYCWAKIPVKTFPIKKESILNCLFIGNGGLYTKVKEGSDQEITDLLEEGKSIGGKYLLREWKQLQPVSVNLQLLGGEANQQQPVWNNFELLSWKIS